MNVLIIYVTVQLLSTACMLAVMDKVKPQIDSIIRDNGYNPNRVNTMIDFNDKLGKILKGLIPLYYAVLSLSLITNKNKIESYALNEINTGKFERTDIKEEAVYEDSEEEYVDESVINENFKVNIRPQKQYNWNIPVSEKYVARRNNDINDFEVNEPIVANEPKEVESEFVEGMGLSPFDQSVFVKPEIQEIAVEDKPLNELAIEEIKEEVEEPVKEVTKETVTKKDIAKAIVALDYKQLDELDAKIRYLSELKKNKKLILDKDVA